MMEKLLVRWSYLVGLLCFGVSVIWKFLLVMNAGLPESIGPSHTLSYFSFFKAGAMFLLISIAAVNYSWFVKQEKP
jgi:hypothetical protein